MQTFFEAGSGLVPAPALEYKIDPDPSVGFTLKQNHLTKICITMHLLIIIII